MTNLVVDPTRFTKACDTNELKKLLVLLIAQTQSNFIVRGDYQVEKDGESLSISLTHHLLIRPRATNEQQFRIEVIRPGFFASGGNAKLFKSEGVLVPEESFAFKTKNDEKSRVCKIIDMKDTSSIEIVCEEVLYAQKNPLLHCKEAIIVEDIAFIIMRNAGEMDLFTLCERMQHGQLTLSLEKRFGLTSAILRAVHHQVHEQNLLHLDLKPENIMLNLQTLKVIVIDYAFARSLDENSTLNSFRGTLRYAAPETVDHGLVSVKSEVFSLGLAIALLWGDVSIATLPETTPWSTLATMHKNRQWEDLFQGMQLDVAMENQIDDLLHQMTHYQEFMRCKLTEAIKAWDDLYEQHVSETRSNSDEDQSNYNPLSFFKAPALLKQTKSMSNLATKDDKQTIRDFCTRMQRCQSTQCVSEQDIVVPTL